MEKGFLSKEYLEEVRKRYEATTPEPWVSFVEGRDFWGGDSVIARGPESIEEDLDLYLPVGTTIADQDFIAHARQDVPTLLEEIERLYKLLQDQEK